MIGCAFVLFGLALQDSGEAILTPTSGLRVVRASDGPHVEFLVNEAGSYKTVALDSLHPKAGTPTDSPLRVDAQPWKEAAIKGNQLLLSREGVTLTITVPSEDHVFHVAFGTTPDYKSSNRAMVGLALAPDGHPTLAAQTFFPPGGSSTLATQERFAVPIALAQGKEYAVAVFPSLQALDSDGSSRPILKIDNTGRVGPAAVVSFGWSAYRRDANWNPVQLDDPLPSTNPPNWSCDVLVTRASSAVREATDFLWERDGAERAKRPLPQTVPWRYYTKPTYALEAGGGEEEGEGEEEEMEKAGQWWVKKSAGKELRAPKNTAGLASLTLDGNVARFAWGLHWWGDRLQQEAWSEHADEVMAFLLSAPVTTNRTLTAFDTKKESWIDGTFDADAEALTARWELAYADSFFYIRTEDVVMRVSRLAKKLLEAKVGGLQAVFLQDLLASKSITDQALKSSVSKKLAGSYPDLIELANAKGFAPPTAQSIALGLALVRSDREEARAAGRSLIESAFLYQAVWKPITVDGTEVFGGFAGDHFVDESQSNFTADLLSACVALEDPILTQRAIAALRSPLALFNHQTHGISGMVYPTETEVFHSVSWFGKNGQADYGPWRGYAEGIGQTLTSAASALDQFGSCYISPKGMKFCIDGLEFGADDQIVSSFSRNPLGFQAIYPYIVIDARTGGTKELTDPEAVPTIRRVQLALDEKGPYVVALPGFSVVGGQTLAGRFDLANGRSLSSELFPTGLGARIPATEPFLERVAFVGKYGETYLTSPWTALSLGPPPIELPWPLGWRWMKGLSDRVRPTLEREGVPILSTADDGRGGRKVDQTGVIESQGFLMTGVQISCSAVATDPSVRIEIVDTSIHAVVAMAAAKDVRDGLIVIDLPRFRGATIKIRLVDESKTGAIDAWDFQVVGS